MVQKVYRCEICGKLFANEYQLSNHMFKHSTKPRITYKCEICGREFANAYQLLNHSLKHKNEALNQNKNKELNANTEANNIEANNTEVNSHEAV